MIAALQAAMEYLARGWAVLPVQIDKTPARRALVATRGTPRWRSLRDDPADQEEVERWFRIDPAAGVGVICQGELAVVDVDDLEHVDVPELPRTATVQTPRPGLHRYYRTHDPARHRTFAWGELRAGGDYVVAPPGVGHRPYRWVVDVELAELPASLSAPHFLGHPLVHTWASLSAGVSADEAAMLAALGLDGVGLGESFRCLLHDDQRASAAVYRGSDGLLRYRCFAGCCGRKGWLSLAGAHAWRAGRRRRLSRTEIAVWAADLRVRAGQLQPVYIPDPACGVPEHLWPCWDGFRRLIGVRWLYRPGAPAPFARDFAAAWCQVSGRQVCSQLDELVERDVIRPAGGDRLRFWLPGPGVVPVD